MLTLPRELLDDILYLVVLESNTYELAGFARTNKRWWALARAFLYETVEVDSMETAVKFLATISTDGAGNVFGDEPKHLLCNCILRLRFFFDARSYTYDIRQKFKAKLKSAMIRTALKEFTFVFSECDSIALDLMTDGMRYSTTSLCMISAEADGHTVRLRLCKKRMKTDK
jgi:hypothetical protein